MNTKEKILKEFEFFSKVSGIGDRMDNNSKEEVSQRLVEIESEPLSKVQLNQLLVLCHEAPVSDSFFSYYWLKNLGHPYDVTILPDCNFDPRWLNASKIISVAHLKWGFYRLFIDALLWFGNVRTAFRKLRILSIDQLEYFFNEKKFDTEMIKQRGPSLPLKEIPKDNRYLISEMACKSYGDVSGSKSQLESALMDAFQEHAKHGGGRITIRDLLENNVVTTKYSNQQQQLIFSADDVLDETVNSEAELKEKYHKIAEQFSTARDAALANTRYYLSMVNDLDVYVATSMRTRQDFRDMGNACDKIFSDSRLKTLHLRYFDPTLSAASGHEDKGLIECLMVKCAKVLVYYAGEKESYGKDAEAAMALSLGKPVIFYCNHEQRRNFYRDVHPLSRLIEFETGVAVGAIVTDSLEQVSELLYRIFENKMEYELDNPRAGYLRLKEKLTGSVVRLQTSDRLLAETFWNHYHNRQR